MPLLTSPRRSTAWHTRQPEAGSLEVEWVNCPFCGGQEHETVLFAEDYLTRLGGSFRVACCRECQLTFTNPRPTLRSLPNFYPETYTPYCGHETGARAGNTWRRRLERAVLSHRYGHPPQPVNARTIVMSWIGRTVIWRSRAREHWFPYQAPGRLFDFGCGAGDFIKRMRESGWTVEGMDVSPKLVDALRENGNLRVHLGTLPHSDIHADSFDVITMWQSLEHVPFPREVLRAAYTALRMGGTLIIGVPNFASWSSRHFRQDWVGLDLPRHLTHFTAKTLSRMVETEGFRVTSLSQIGHVGAIRKSARRAASRGEDSFANHCLRWHWYADLVAQWTERRQGDSLKLIAEKI